MERLAHYLVGVAAVVAVAASGTALAGAMLNLGPALESDFAQTISNQQQMAAVASATATTQGSSLTETQIQAITSLLTSFNVDPATIATVDSVLRHKAPVASGSGGEGMQGGRDGAMASSTHPLPTLPATAAAVCARIDHALGRGDSDATSTGQVHELQQFLAQHFGLATTDLMTGYFGSTTQAWVSKFQSEQGIDPVGSAGPKTRAAIMRFCGGTASSTPGVLPPLPPHAGSAASGTPPMPPQQDNQGSDNQQSNAIDTSQNVASVSVAFGEIGDGIGKLVSSYFALFGL